VPQPLSEGHGSVGSGFSPDSRGDRATEKARVAQPLLSEGHGLSHAIKTRAEGPTVLPQAGFSRETGNRKLETGAASKRETCNVKPCSFLHPDGRPCGSPAMKKSRSGLCYQHALKLRAKLLSKGHGFSRAIEEGRVAPTALPQADRSGSAFVVEQTGSPTVLTVGAESFSSADKDRAEGFTLLPQAGAPQERTRETGNGKRETRKALAAAELRLTPIRRLRRSIDDRRQRIRDLFWTLPPLTTPAAIDLALDHIDRAHAEGVFDDRTARIMRRCARLARTTLKGNDPASDPSTWPLPPLPPLPTRWKRAALKAAIKAHYAKGSR